MRRHVDVYENRDYNLITKINHNQVRFYTQNVKLE